MFVSRTLDIYLYRSVNRESDDVSICHIAQNSSQAFKIAVDRKCIFALKRTKVIGVEYNVGQRYMTSTESTDA
jgi:hypothetical protein